MGLLIAKKAMPLMRKLKTNLEVFVMNEKIRKFMDKPLTIRRELKINLIAAGILMTPLAIIMIYVIYQSNKAINDFKEAVDKRTEEMKKNVYLGK